MPYDDTPPANDVPLPGGLEAQVERQIDKHVTDRYHLGHDRPLTWKGMAPMLGAFALAVLSLVWVISDRPWALFKNAYAQDQAAVDTRFKAEKERREKQ